MIDKMMEQHKARRNQLQNEEMFEPIEIDFGYEDAVAFDSDKGIFQGLPRSKLSRIPTVKLKIPGKSRIQKFCNIQVFSSTSNFQSFHSL